MLKKLFLTLVSGMGLLGMAHAATPIPLGTQADESGACPAALQFNVIPLGGKIPVNLCQAYKGKVLLVVNTASFCGFTKQYKALEAMYARYKDQGFYVLGFPANDFGEQEPGDDKAIKDFCDATYKVKFPMFKKTRSPPITLTRCTVSWRARATAVIRNGTSTNISSTVVVRSSLTSPAPLPRITRRLPVLLSRR